MKKALKKAIAVAFGVLVIGTGVVACGKNSENTDNIPSDEDNSIETVEPSTPVNPVIIPAHEHNVIRIDGKEATCEESGYDEYRLCKDCGVVLADDGETTTVRTLPATGHSYETKEVEVGCTFNGYVEHKCKSCGDNYRDGIVVATGHEYEATEITIQPTCEHDGERKLECAKCSDIKTERIDKLDHRYEIIEKEATCEENGYIKYICKECGEERIEQTDEAEGHDYRGTPVSATCETCGGIEYKCSVCGDKYIEKTSEALGHKYLTEITQPTCMEGGYTEYTCKVCQYNCIGDETEPSGHEWNDGSIIKPATCKQAGEVEYCCKSCGATKTEEIAKTEHEYSAEWSSDESGHWREANCECEETDRGEHEMADGECATCGYGESLEYADNGDGTLTVTGKGSVTANDIVIPNEYKGKRVTRIDDGAFSGDKKITTVRIGSNVEYIGKGAFKGCTAIRKIEFEEKSGWYYTKNADATSGTRLAITSSVYLEFTTNRSDYYFKRSAE